MRSERWGCLMATAQAGDGRAYEQLLRELHRESPDDTNLAAALIEMDSIQATEATAHRQNDRARQLNDEAASMIEVTLCESTLLRGYSS